MRVSKYPLMTLKETPADAEIISHQLMLRSGMVRKLASGLYTWLPLGLRILQKVEKVIREEMNRSGALEVLMPTIHPAELWQESTRWQQYGPELLRITDRHNREYCYGPTHEEVITDLVRREINSYKQLPVNYYQIQLKFRDEIRPRFGVMRAREFIMKDAYSFHTDEASLDETYQVMHRTYSAIFSRLGLKFRAVQADSGAIGGNTSQEFHVLAESGEDAIAYSSGSHYAANVQMAEAVAPTSDRAAMTQKMQLVDTPNKRSIEEVTRFLGIEKKHCIKTLLVKGINDTNIGLLIRGDHTLNEIKVEKLECVEKPLQFVDNDEIKTKLNTTPGYLGPIGLDIHIIADRSTIHMSDFVCGANQADKHYTGVNWERDIAIPEIADIRNVEEGDPSPDGEGSLKIVRGIEVGHIFKLGTKYSESMQATVLDENGKSVLMPMGCYGIGVTRVVAAAIEQNHDERGINWPLPLAPFQVALIPINMHKSEEVNSICTQLYQQFTEQGIEVLFDDRDTRPGIKFADMELIGIPHRIVISDKTLQENKAEYKNRTGTVDDKIDIGQIVNYIENLIRDSNN